MLAFGLLVMLVNVLSFFFFLGSHRLVLVSPHSSFTNPAGRVQPHLPALPLPLNCWLRPAPETMPIAAADGHHLMPPWLLKMLKRPIVIDGEK